MGDDVKALSRRTSGLSCNGVFRPLAVVIAAIAAAAVAPVARGAAPQPAAATLVCTNPASHVRWRIHVDFAAVTVDSNRARIGTATISWHDRADGRNYTLHRGSGELTVVVASSTGGYFIHDRCVADTLKSR